ncbi:hypothetical protein D3C78_1765150 [compost metagenome]
MFGSRSPVSLRISSASASWFGRSEYSIAKVSKRSATSGGMRPAICVIASNITWRSVPA